MQLTLQNNAIHIAVCCLIQRRRRRRWKSQTLQQRDKCPHYSLQLNQSIAIILRTTQKTWAINVLLLYFFLVILVFMRIESKLYKNIQHTKKHSNKDNNFHTNVNNFFAVKNKYTHACNFYCSLLLFHIFILRKRKNKWMQKKLFKNNWNCVQYGLCLSTISDQ